MGKITSENVDTHKLTESRKDLSQGRVTYLAGPSITSDINIGNRDQQIMARKPEKESDGAVAAMDDVELYSEGLTIDGIHNTSEHSEDMREQCNTSKKNVRIWKRVARGNSSYSQTEELGQFDTKRKHTGELRDDNTEIKKVKITMLMDNSLIAAEPEIQARREP